MVDTPKAESLVRHLSKNLSDHRKKLGLTQDEDSWPRWLEHRVDLLLCARKNPALTGNEKAP